jgi:hypothetical protein
LVGQSLTPLFAGRTKIVREAMRRKAKIPTTGLREWRFRLYLRRNIFIFIVILLHGRTADVKNIER